MHRSDMYTHSPSLSSMIFVASPRHLQANSLENDVLLLEARPFAMELQKLLTSQTLTKLEPRNLAKTCSSMGYLAMIDSATSKVRVWGDGNSREIPKGLWLGRLGKIPSFED